MIASRDTDLKGNCRLMILIANLAHRYSLRISAEGVRRSGRDCCRRGGAGEGALEDSCKKILLSLLELLESARGLERRSESS